MGISLKNIFNENEDELVVNRSRNAIKVLMLMAAVVAVVLIIASVAKGIYEANNQELRRSQLIQDAKVLQSAVQNLANEYRANPASVQLVGMSLEDNPVVINVNGIEEEYRYGYYWVTSEYIKELTNALNLPSESYIVNYDTYDVINYAGVKYEGGRYHSIEDLLYVEQGITPPPKQMIRTAADLDKIRSNPNGYFRLSGNLDLSSYSLGEGWMPIEQFGGTLDGRGYTISNLTISRPSAKNVGLFGELQGTAKITNLTLENVNIIGGESVGALAGISAANISYVNVVSGDVSGQTKYIGGLVGSQSIGTISNCKISLSSISGNDSVGGIIGVLNSGTLAKSSSNTSIIGTESVGGAIGLVSLSSGTYVQEVATKTTLTASRDVGGIIGKISILRNSKFDFQNSYAKGTIRGTNTNSGGLVGSMTVVGDANIVFKSLYTTVDILVKDITSGGCVGYTDITVTAAVSMSGCFWEKDLAPGEVLRDIGSRASNTFILSFDNKTYDEMRIRNTFVNWNFDIWGIDERVDTPYLKWQI